MTINMDDSLVSTIEQLEAFLKANEPFEFNKLSKDDSYEWIRRVLVRFGYCSDLNKRGKGLVRKYIQKVTGYSRSQTAKLIKKYVKTGVIVVKVNPNKHRFARKYSQEDIKLLAETDKKHNTPNGVALKKILENAYRKYNEVRYKTLCSISVAYIYILRTKPAYQKINGIYEKTKPCVVNIGERTKPAPYGRPGFLRIDSVHQGDDRDGQKGLYHINFVDEVTQTQFVGSVSQITDYYLLPLLETLIGAYFFKVIGFHTDNGSEYINQRVKEMLNRLLIKQTKSRPRHSNDNALVESKNNIIRKFIGYGFIAKKHASKINAFYTDCFNEYLNFHRYCAFPSEIADPKKKGKIKKVYLHENYMTPYQKLKSLENAKMYLREGITFEYLDTVEARHTDNEMADIVQKDLTNLSKEVYHSVLTSRTGSFID